jgi:hypothetical protein
LGYDTFFNELSRVRKLHGSIAQLIYGLFFFSLFSSRQSLFVF